MSRTPTFKEDTRDLKVIIERTDQLCHEIHKKLVERGFNFRSVRITAVMKDWAFMLVPRHLKV